MSYILIPVIAYFVKTNRSFVPSMCTEFSSKNVEPVYTMASSTAYSNQERVTCLAGLELVNLNNIIQSFDSQYYVPSSSGTTDLPWNFAGDSVPTPTGTQNDPVYAVHANPKMGLRSFGSFGTLRPNLKATTKKPTIMKLTAKSNPKNYVKMKKHRGKINAKKNWKLKNMCT